MMTLAPADIRWLRTFFARWRQTTRRRRQPFFDLLRSLNRHTLKADEELIAVMDARLPDGEDKAMVALWRAWNRFVEGERQAAWRAYRQIQQRRFYSPLPPTMIGISALAEGNRAIGHRALRRAIRLDRQHHAARELVLQMGVRRQPVLPFLPRGNKLNIALGKLRARVRR